MHEDAVLYSKGVNRGDSEEAFDTRHQCTVRESCHLLRPLVAWNKGKNLDLAQAALDLILSLLLTSSLDD